MILVWISNSSWLRQLWIYPPLHKSAPWLTSPGNDLAPIDQLFWKCPLAWSVRPRRNLMLIRRIERLIIINVDLIYISQNSSPYILNAHKALTSSGQSSCIAEQRSKKSSKEKCSSLAEEKTRKRRSLNGLYFNCGNSSITSATWKRWCRSSCISLRPSWENFFNILKWDRVALKNELKPQRKCTHLRISYLVM